MSTATFVRAVLPPGLVRIAGRLMGRSLRFNGQPASWPEALRISQGYADEIIVERVVRATREVIAGRAAYERDSVLFNVPQPPFQLLMPILRHALIHGSKLEVVDVGGSLGSTWRQCRSMLPPLKSLVWHVIEQECFVAAGRAEFETDELRFYESISELPPPHAPRLLLASSVLQYLERPHERLAEWASVEASTLVIDRSPISGEPQDSLCIQTVPRHIYPASYPCWILSRARLLAELQSNWLLLSEFDCPEGAQVASGDRHFSFKGLILERRT